jgi:hypothetical protein
MSGLYLNCLYIYIYIYIYIYMYSWLPVQVEALRGPMPHTRSPTKCLKEITKSVEHSLEKLIVTKLVKKFSAFMEPECLLACS